MPLALRWLGLESAHEFAATQRQVLDKLPITARGKEESACWNGRLGMRVPLSHVAYPSTHPSLLSIPVSAPQVLGTPLLFSCFRLKKKNIPHCLDYRYCACLQLINLRKGDQKECFTPAVFLNGRFSTGKISLGIH